MACLKVLDYVLKKKLPALLQNDETLWNGVWVDYDKPNVERVWCQWGDYRICLHRIHPCNPGEPFYHPHPWPCSMRIFKGNYEHGIGYGAGMEPPPIKDVYILSPNSEHESYEMTDRDDWHYVRPINEVAMTIMVSGKPFDPPRVMPKLPENKSMALAPEKVEDILRFFREYYKI